MSPQDVIFSRYLDKIFEKKALQETVKQAIKYLQQINEKYPFDFIAFTGNSGAGLSFILNYLTKYPIVLVRKSSDKTHGYEIEGTNIKCNGKKYLIVDDLIDSGNTVKFITSKLLDRCNSKCSAVYLYNDCYIIPSILNSFMFPIFSFNGVQLNKELK